MKYHFITQYKKIWPVTVMCQVPGACRSGYYHFVRTQNTYQPEPLHLEMLEWVKKIAKASDFTYGVRRMKHALNCLGYPVGKSRTRSLMREAGVKVKRRKKYKVTTNSNHNNPVFDNILARNFDVSKPDTAWVSDITYGVPGIRHLRGWHKRITNLSEIYTFETGVKNV